MRIRNGRMRVDTKWYSDRETRKGARQGMQDKRRTMGKIRRENKESEDKDRKIRKGDAFGVSL